MRVLLTGHKGFIGQNMYNFLAYKGYDIVTFDILDSPNTRPKDLPIERVDAVIHLGAISSTTELNIQKLMDLNLSWSIELLEQCNKHNILLQFASSASVYGNIYQHPMNENLECAPLNNYAMTKYLFEKYVEKSKHSNVVQIFRYFNVYGPYEEHKGSQASPYYQFIKQAKTTGLIKIFEGSKHCIRDFVHVSYLVSTQEQMLNIKKSGTWNIGSGICTSFYNLAKSISTLYNADITTIPFPENLLSHYQYYTCADTNNLKTVLGII